jgi:hypothetical protein
MEKGKEPFLIILWGINKTSIGELPADEADPAPHVDEAK